MKKQKICLYLFVLLIFMVLGTNAYAATIGQQLLNPEPGWTRIDDTNTFFKYTGSWKIINNSTSYQGSEHLTNYQDPVANGSKVSIAFKGSKFRLIGSHWTTSSNQIDIYINGVKDATISQNPGGVMLRQVLCYEKIFDDPGEYLIEIVNRTTYYLSVDAIDIDDTGDVMDINQPRNLIAEAGDAQVSLSWTAVTGATGYKVKRATTTGGPYTTIASNLNSTTYNDTTVTNGTTYYYVVTALTSSGESENSTEVSATPQQTAPDAPTNLMAIASDSQVSLNWNTVLDATSYNVKRAVAAGGPYETVTSSVYGTTYTDTTVTNGTTYYYVVTAIVDGVESGNSNEASATPQAPVSEGRAVLWVTMCNGSDIDYDLSMDEVNAFINWYKSKASGGVGDPFYTFSKTPISPYTDRMDYLIFDKIVCFKVNRY